MHSPPSIPRVTSSTSLLWVPGLFTAPDRILNVPPCTTVLVPRVCGPSLGRTRWKYLGSVSHAHPCQPPCLLYDSSYSEGAGATKAGGTWRFGPSTSANTFLMSSCHSFKDLGSRKSLTCPRGGPPHSRAPPRKRCHQAFIRCMKYDIVMRHSYRALWLTWKIEVLGQRKQRV